MPNAAISRHELLEQAKILEMELSVDVEFSADEKSEVKKWAQIYSHSYNESLTGCVDQLLQLEKFAKAIVGEYGYVSVKTCAIARY